MKVSVIYPGMTDTKMLRDINLPVDPVLWMLPEDITGCILFLLKQSDRIVIKVHKFVSNEHSVGEQKDKKRYRFASRVNS